MSKQIPILLPKLGESILSATIVQVLKQPGQKVEKDEALFEVATDKVNSEIPSPVSGILIKIAVQIGEEVQVGDTLAIIDTEQVSDVTKQEPEAIFAKEEEETVEFLSPLVLQLAKQYHITMQELQSIQGTGKANRVTKKDVLDYLARKSSQFPSSQDVEILPMSSMRKTIADNMVKSFYTAPHASLMTEVDVTNIVSLIENKKRDLLKQDIKLSITSFLSYALAQAAKAFPLVNSSVDKDTIIVKKSIHLGLAVNIKEGLLVPIIKNAHNLTLLQFCERIQDLSSRAKKAELQLFELQDGTITLSNFGMTGIQMGIPIIRYGEVAIIGAGAIQKKWCFMGEDHPPTLRSILTLSFSFDHRAFDGIYACGFLHAMKEILEKKHFQDDL